MDLEGEKYDRYAYLDAGTNSYDIAKLVQVGDELQPDIQNEMRMEKTIDNGDVVFKMRYKESGVTHVKYRGYLMED